MGLFDFGVEDVHALISGHDPAQTRVEVQGDWLLVEIGRPERDGHPAGIGQTIYLYCRGALHPDGTRAARTAAELRADLALLLVDEFKRASVPPDESASASASRSGAREPATPDETLAHSELGGAEPKASARRSRAGAAPA